MIESSMNHVGGRYRKIDSISDSLDTCHPNIETLRKFCISPRGLVSNELRRRAWPLLLNIDMSNALRQTFVGRLELAKHRDYQQVVMDVDRMKKRFHPSVSDVERNVLQRKLIKTTVRVLDAHPELNYYQGFHDICASVLLAVGHDLSLPILEKLCLVHLRDFLDPNMDRTRHMLGYIFPIIQRVRPPLTRHMETADFVPFFAVSWLITWYSHVLSDQRDIFRLFDFFIASHPLMPVYLAAAIVIHRESEVLACDPDLASLHALLSQLPTELPLEFLITQSTQLFHQHPPDTLVGPATASASSDALLNYDHVRECIRVHQDDHIVRSQRPPLSRGRSSSDAGLAGGLSVADGLQPAAPGATNSSYLRYSVWVAVTAAATAAIASRAMGAGWSW